jgi:hypothetical protein
MCIVFAHCWESVYHFVHILRSFLSICPHHSAHFDEFSPVCRRVLIIATGFLDFEPVLIG